MSLRLPLLASAALLFACGAPVQPGFDPNAVSILTCTSRTGALSHLGPSVEKGFTLALDDINAGGGVLGKPLQLVRADDHSEVKAGLVEAEFYYARYKQNTVGIVGSLLDSVTRKLLSDLANADLVYGNKIPILSPASASPDFSESLDASGLFFRTVMSANFEGEALARKAERLGYRKGFVIAIDDTLGQRMAETFRRTFTLFGADHSLEVVTYSGAKRAEILAAFNRLSGTQPDFLLLIAYGEDGQIALSEWAARFPGVPLLLTSALASNPLLAGLDQRTLSSLERGQVNGTVPSNDPQSPGFDTFNRAFCTREPDECRCPPELPGCDVVSEGRAGSYVANAYDAVYLLALAVERAGRANPAATTRGPTWDVQAIGNQILRSANGQGTSVTLLPNDWASALAAFNAGQEVDYQGASAKDLELDANGDVRSGYYTLWTVRANSVVFTNSEGQSEAVDISF